MRKTLANLVTTLSSSLGSAVNSVIIGEVMPKQSDLPAIQIYPSSTEIDGVGAMTGTVKDKQIRTVTIRAIVSVAQEMGQTPSQLNTASSILSVCDLMEKRDADGAMNSASVMGVLRQDPDNNSQALFDQNMVIDYNSLDQLGYPNATATVQVSYVTRNLRR